MDARFNSFAGMIPVVDARLLPPTNAQLARDCELDSGNIKPLREPAIAVELTDPFRTSAYKYISDAYTAGYVWLDWLDGVVNVFKSPVSQDLHNRIYYIDPTDKKLKVRSGTNEYLVGVPPPTTPTVTTKPRPPGTWIRVWRKWNENLGGVKSGEAGYYPESETAAALTFKPGTDDTEAGQTDDLRASNWFMSSAHQTYTNNKDNALIPWFRAYVKKSQAGGSEESNRGLELGQLIPKINRDNADRSQNRSQSDFGINGVKCEARYTDIDFDTNTVEFHNNPKIFRMSYRTTGATLTTSYVCTFINIFGEESEPSAPTPVININPFRIAVLGSLDNGSAWAAAGYAPITKLRVYRVVTGDESAVYKYVGEIVLSSTPTTWDDIAFDVEAGETLPTAGSARPPDDLHGLVHLAGGFFAAFSGQSVYFSHPYNPFSWPPAYELTFPYEVKALGVSGNTLAVLTVDKPFLVTGYEPATMQQSQMAIPFPCVNPYVTEWGGAILYISNEGLIALDGQAGRNLTEQYWSRNQWLALQPETLHMTTYKEKIYLFADLKSLETLNRVAESISGYDSFVVYPNDERKAVNALSTYVQGIWNDLSNDALYVIRGTKLLLIEASPTYFESRYISKEVAYGDPSHPIIVRIAAEKYPVKVTFIGNGKPVQTIIINDDRARKVPVMRKERFWSVQVDSRYVVRDIVIGSSMRALK